MFKYKGITSVDQKGPQHIEAEEQEIKEYCAVSLNDGEEEE